MDGKSRASGMGIAARATIVRHLAGPPQHSAALPFQAEDEQGLCGAADYYGHPRATQAHEHHFFDDIDMHSFIAAMARRFPIQLAITVGHPAMIGTGPLGGRPVETGLIIASTDALAADVAGAHLFGFEPQAVRHLWEAGRLGVGETSVQNMEFPAMSLEQAYEAFTTAAYGQRLSLTQ
jgi:hypothetical protein